MRRDGGAVWFAFGSCGIVFKVVVTVVGRNQPFDVKSDRRVPQAAPFLVRRTPVATKADGAFGCGQAERP